MIGTLLKALKEQEGFTYDQIGKLIGKDLSTAHRLINGDTTNPHDAEKILHNLKKNGFNVTYTCNSIEVPINRIIKLDYENMQIKQ